MFPAARRRSSVSSRPSAITATKNELKFPQIKPNVAAVGFGGLDPEPSRAAPALEYWSLLGLQSGATNNEIKKAYLKLAAEFHPDKFVLYDEEDQLASAAKFAQIGEVYRVLKDYPNVFAFDPTPYFCNSEICSGYSTEFGYIYRDIDHLSRLGSIYYADRLFGSFSFFE